MLTLEGIYENITSVLLKLSGGDHLYIHLLFW